MIKTLQFLFLICSGLLLTGCLTAARYDYIFDYKTGAFEITYYDIQTVKLEEEEDYDPDKDLEMLLEIAYEPDNNYSPGVVEMGSRELFQDGEVLSGKIVDQVTCPECFPSKAALLSLLIKSNEPDRSEWRVDMVQKDIFLFLPYNKVVLSSNGQIISTENSQIIVWPDSTEFFEYSIGETELLGQSLLPYFLNKKSI